MNRRSVFYDLETTGVGKGIYGPLTNPVGIYSVGYGRPGGKAKSMFGKSDVPMEPGAQHIADLPSNVRGLSSTQLTEKQMLRQFVSDLKQSGATELVGFNIHNYDSPLLIKRLRHLGLSAEADHIANMRHVDVMHMVKGLMDRSLSPYREKIDWDFGAGKVPKGLSLQAIAKGLGITSSEAHAAESDVVTTRKVYELAQDPRAFMARFNPLAWAEGVDELSLERAMLKIGRPYQAGNTVTHQQFVDVTDTNPLKPQIFRAQKMGLRTVQDFIGPVQYNRFGGDLPLMGGDWNPQAKMANQAEQLAETEGISISEAKERVSKGLDTAKDGALKGMGDVIKAGQSAVDKIDGIAVGKAGALIAGLAGATWLSNKLQPDEDVGSENYISASLLGSDSAEIRELVSQNKNIRGMNRAVDERATFGAMKAGRKVHEKIQEQMAKTSGYVGSEISAVDPYLGIKGIADLVMNIDGQEVPIEIKTVDDSAISEMSGPTRKHSAQANFYAHAFESDHAYVMYVSRDNPDNRVSFRVNYDPGSLLAQTQAFREAVFMAGHSEGWKVPLESFFGNLSGTRDQANRNYFLGYPRTERPIHHSNLGSRTVPRND